MSVVSVMTAISSVGGLGVMTAAVGAPAGVVVSMGTGVNVDVCLVDPGLVPAHPVSMSSIAIARIYMEGRAGTETT